MNKTLLIVVVLVGMLAFASSGMAANWYVDNAANGAENGQSWSDAWNSFAAIQWNSVSPGDTIYISGGTNSKTYNEQLTVQASGTPGNLITIRAGVDAGHNGRVIFDGQSTIASGVLIDGRHTDGYIKVEKLEFRYFTGRGQVSIFANNPSYGATPLKHIVVESSKFTENRGHGGVFAAGYNWQGGYNELDEVYILNNDFSVGDSQNGRDNIYVADASNVYIQGNTIRGDNDITDHHDDDIQFVRVHNSVISNNYMYEKSNTPDRPNQVMMWEGISGTHIIYNNVFYAPNQINYMNNFIDKNNLYPKTYYIMHNTVYGGSNANLFNVNTNTDAYMYNNIFYNSMPGGGGVKYLYPQSAYTGDWSLTDGNLYGNYQPGAFYGMSMTAMNNLGAETSGNPLARFLVDPLFVSEATFPNEDLHLQSGSPAIDAGVDVQALVESLGLEWKDMDGNLRDSTPDIGAYEFGGTPPPTCSQLGGTVCQQGQTCEGGNFQYSSDYGNLCCVGGTCSNPPQTCNDGTTYGSCSSNEPLFCQNGNLIDNCQTCGCPSGEQCNSDGSCSVPPPTGDCTPGDTRSCTVPGTTGQCALGTQTCTGNQQWGSCQGPSPQTEICTGGLDENCNGQIDCADSSCSNDPVCQGTVPPPDADGDGCVDIGELFVYFGFWEQGIVSQSDLQTAVDLWTVGCPVGGTTGGFSPNTIVEAEDGELILPMESFGNYIATPTSNVGSASYTFSVSQPGEYYLEAKTLASSEGRNSFYIGIDGYPAAGDNSKVFDIAVSSSFSWDEVSARGPEGNFTWSQYDPRVWILDVGQHTFTFHGRESNTKLDQLILKTDPQGDPEICSDGTEYSMCSANPPIFCDGGALVEDCNACGCPAASPVCNSDGSCSVFEECTPGTFESCPTGEPGICATGERTCTSSGNWGGCVAPNPQTEICDDGIDQDCDGSDLSCSTTNDMLTIYSATDNGQVHESENPIGHTFDGSLSTRWASRPVPIDIIFDLGTVQEVQETRLSFYRWDQGRVYQYSIDVSTVGSGFTTVVPLGGSANNQWTIDTFNPIQARYVRVHFESQSENDWAGFWEAEIWGTDQGNPQCTDGDGDGRGAGCPAGTDCNDNDPNVWNTISCPYNGNTCGSYQLCLQSCPVPPPENCGNGQDDDCDGQTDCADSSCSNDPACAPVCGDGTCNGEETCSTCETDCGICPEGNLWYVDNAASGANDGSSWVDAWQSFASISWGSVNPGDTVYLSGGVDSKVYYEQLYITDHGTAANPITIRNSLDAGHNGRVIIDDSEEKRYNIFLVSAEYIILSGFEVRNGYFNIFVRNTGKSITIDSMTIYDWTYQGFHTAGDGEPEDIDGILIQDSSWISSPDFGGDAITFNLASNIVIRNNYIHIQNAQRANAHIDGILALKSEGFKVYNNVIILDSNAQGQAYIIRAWTDSASEDPVIVYNNFMYQGGIWDSSDWPWTSVLNLRWQSEAGQVKPPTYVLHNTIVSNGPYVAGVVHEVPSTFVNNIVAQFGDGTGINLEGGNNIWIAAMRGSSGGLQTESVRNNLIWREWPVNNPNDLFIGSWSGCGNSASGFGWSTWVNTLCGTGINANPLFVDENVGAFGAPPVQGDQGALRGYLQAGSPAINQGEDIQALVESFGLPWTDINGNPRDSTPDIGAYETGS